MAEETTGTEGEEQKGADSFDPKSLSTEAQEHIRREVQKQSDTKAAAATAAEVAKIRAADAQSARTAVERAEENELRQLASSGDAEGVGKRVIARLDQRSAEEAAIGRASEYIERQMAAAFTEGLGPEKVAEVQAETAKSGGAHAEFAMGLAKAADSKTRAEEITAEVKAQLTEAGVKVRDETAGPDAGTKGGQGQPPEGFDKVQQAYIDGTLGPTPAENRKAYEKAKEARQGSR